jgi:hypothetical protein
MSRSFMTRVAGVEPPPDPNADKAYWTFDRNFVRWDVYMQPTGDWSAYTSNYGDDIPVQLSPDESGVWKRIEAIASTLKPKTLLPGKSINPTFAYKHTPISPEQHGPPSPPINSLSLTETGMPTPPHLQQAEPPKKKSDYILVAGVAAVAAFLFIGTLKVK